MKKITILFFIFPVLGAVIFYSFFYGNKNSPPANGQMSKFSLYGGISTVNNKAFWLDEGGKKYTLKDHNNKIVLINFWATWCAPCIKELPSIHRLNEILDSEYLTIIALNLDADRNKHKAKELIAKLNLSGLDAFYDPDGSFADSVKVSVIPTTILFDRTGNELGRLIGSADWGSPEALDLIKYFISKKQ